LPKSILVVDDEPTLVATLRYNFEREGFLVYTAADGEAALAEARAHRPDVIVLDIMLPALTGLEVCRILRAETAVPILMLTAKTEEIDKVVGLEIGADDYVTKPFSVRELVARVRALMRRAELPPSDESETLRAGDLIVDLRARKVTRNGDSITLRPKEFDLLVCLLRNRGRVLTREQLLNDIWGYDFVGDSRTVDVHVRWLREKVEEEPAKPTRLITVRGVGYRLDG
jgi:DNA-binding response OmpR family regulator